MRTTISLLFSLRKPKNYQSGEMPIYLRITVDGQRTELAVSRKCDPVRWDAVSGEIIESRMWIRRPSHWAVEIRYRYTVEGLTYEADRVGFWKARRFWSLGAAERLVTMYPKGRIVTLFVSPSDRSLAVIEPGVGWRAAVPFLSGGLLAAFGIASLLH